MTWAEFQLRLFAYNRIQKNEWLKITELSTNALIAGFIDGKEKKKRENAEYYFKMERLIGI